MVVGAPFRKFASRPRVGGRRELGRVEDIRRLRVIVQALVAEVDGLHVHRDFDVAGAGFLIERDLARRAVDLAAPVRQAAAVVGFESGIGVRRVDFVRDREQLRHSRRTRRMRYRATWERAYWSSASVSLLNICLDGAGGSPPELLRIVAVGLACGLRVEKDRDKALRTIERGCASREIHRDSGSSSRGTPCPRRHLRRQACSISPSTAGRTPSATTSIRKRLCFGFCATRSAWSARNTVAVSASAALARCI